MTITSMKISLCVALLSFWPGVGTGRADVPTDNPVRHYRLSWTDDIAWLRSVSIDDFKGETADARLQAAQEAVAAKGGGVIYFPDDVYQFSDHIAVKNGIVLRGADPVGETDARGDKYAPPTRFVFPRYEFRSDGDGVAIASAFKGIRLHDPAAASRCGLINIAIERGHIDFNDDGSDKHRCGDRRVIFGCMLRNAAVADPAVPDLKIGQKPWQRFTQRHHAAITVRGENVLVANNRLPQSAEDNFTMKGYVVRKGKESVTLDEVVFDYDNRPGLYVNDYGIGAAGGSSADDGTPDKYLWGFRKGIIIRDNYIWCSGRCAISFCGDGTLCANNIIRFPPEVNRPTATGRDLTGGASTNDNRAVQMRGWRWVVEGNDYVVHRNRSGNKAYLINDGEGLMHEDHVNSTVLDSKLIGNKGNSYLSIYRTGGINGLLVKGNDIRTAGGISAIYVSADRNSGRHECRNVTIEDNTTAGSGILISGSPASGNIVRNNRHVHGAGVIDNRADALVENNTGYVVKGQ